MKPVSAALLSLGMAAPMFSADASAATAAGSTRNTGEFCTTVESCAQQVCYPAVDNWGTCESYSQQCRKKKWWHWWETCKTVRNPDYACITSTTAAFCNAPVCTDVQDCQPCASGKYALNNGCTSCPMGTYSTSTPNDGVSAGCLNCPKGKLTSGSTRSSSSDCKDCPAGTFSANEGSIVKWPECGQCESGTASEAGKHECTACDAGKDSSQGDVRDSCATCEAGKYHSIAAAGQAISQDCIAKSTCDTGTGVQLIGSELEDTKCETCNVDEKSFSTEDDLSACQDHAKCVKGEGSNYWDLAAGASTTSECTPCTAGATFSTGNNFGPCSTVTVSACAPGSRFVAGTVSTDSECKSCTGTTYNSDAGQDDICHEKTASCPAGEELTESGTNKANDVCTECNDRYFKTTAGAGKCQDKTATCEGGFWLDLHTDDHTQNSECNSCTNSKPELNSQWAGLSLGSVCPWECMTGYELTHGGSKCGKPGASVTLKASGSSALLQMHDNGAIVLKKLGGGDDRTCLDAHLCGPVQVAALPADARRLGEHARRLGEMDVSIETLRADMEARMSNMEALMASVAAKAK